MSRLSYALSQGDHRADVALVYPLSTVHAHWREGSKFDGPAEVAQKTTFALAESIYSSGLDFDFVDEAGLVRAKAERGKLQLAGLEFPVVVLPTMTTIRRDALMRLKALVESGGTLVVFRGLPTASAEEGRDDPLVRQIWQDLLGDRAASEQAIVDNRHAGGGHAILVRMGEAAAVAAAIRSSIAPDVTSSEPGVIHTHQQVGRQHVYFFVNRRPEKRAVALSLRERGTPEIWDAWTGQTRPLHRYELHAGGTRLRLEMQPHEGTVVVLDPQLPAADEETTAGRRPQVIADNLASIDDVRAANDGFDVIGKAAGPEPLEVKVAARGRTYMGRAAAPKIPETIAFSGIWECEYRPTMHNRWGDYRYPPSDTLIGPEAPRIKYRAEPAGSKQRPDWHAADLNDRDWQAVTCTYGPYWQTLGPISPEDEAVVLRQGILEGPRPTSTVELGGKPLAWKPYVYSWKFGHDRVETAFDGMGPVSPDFLVFDPPKGGKAAVRYLWTRVFAPRQTQTYLHFGSDNDRTPRRAWVNGAEIVAVNGDKVKAVGPVTLREGWNQVAARLLQPAGKKLATFAVFHPSSQTPDQPRFMPLSRWYESSAALVYDGLPMEVESIGWYRFLAPPGRGARNGTSLRSRSRRG